jgi:predicted NUDIX family phosphoesterase
MAHSGCSPGGAVLASLAMNKDLEEVLVVDRSLVERLGMFQGLTLDTDKYLPELLNPRNHRFVPRHKAEQDESLKQLIPYFLICHQDKIWCYVRGKKSGEERLVAKASIGIGGHINHEDLDLLETDIYGRAAIRELEEEVAVPRGYTHKVVALLNDDLTAVGRVHLGVIHILRAPSAEVSKREGVITESGFKTLSELKGMFDRMETWSQICLDQIDALLARG